jgi:transcription elongation GreA/GreB family factor
MTLKHQILSFCTRWVDERIAAIEDSMKQSQAAANSETKSSAGDKYETGRSMMQIELENLSGQLSEALKLRNTLKLIDSDLKNSNVKIGSIVMSTHGNYFISIPAGHCVIDGVKFMIISSSSPMGMKIMGLKKGDSFEFRGTHVVIDTY